MLKIREDVDLKELEKFGFMESVSYARGTQKAYVQNVTFGRIVIFEDNRGIYIENVEDCVRYSDELCVIYDLIKANLVVKENE